MVTDFNDDTQRVDGVTTGQTSIVITLPAYVAGDVVGGLIEFNVHSAGGGGRITDFYLTDAANQSEAFTLYFFDQKPTVIADADPFAGSIVIGDIDKLIAVEDLVAGRYKTINSLGWARLPDLEMNFEASEGIIYMYAVAVATPDYAAATDLKMSTTALLN